MIIFGGASSSPVLSLGFVPQTGQEESADPAPGHPNWQPVYRRHLSNFIWDSFAWRSRKTKQGPLLSHGDWDLEFSQIQSSGSRSRLHSDFKGTGFPSHPYLGFWTPLDYPGRKTLTDNTTYLLQLFPILGLVTSAAWICLPEMIGRGISSPRRRNQAFHWWCGAFCLTFSRRRTTFFPGGRPHLKNRLGYTLVSFNSEFYGGCALQTYSQCFDPLTSTFYIESCELTCTSGVTDILTYCDSDPPKLHLRHCPSSTLADHEAYWLLSSRQGHSPRRHSTHWPKTNLTTF